MNKLTNKENRDRLIDREQMTALVWGCWGVERLSKKEKSLMNKNNSVTIAWGGWRWKRV